MANNIRFNIDILIVTALPVEVWSALQVFNKNDRFRHLVIMKDYIKSLREGSEFGVFHYGCIESHNKTKHHILIVKPKDMGSNNVEDLLKEILKTWKPRFIILIGIAMSYDENKAKLGDIVVAKKSLCYIREKHIGNRNVLFTNDYDHEINEELSNFINNGIENGISIDISNYLPTGEQRYSQKILLGEFFSSDKLISSTEYRAEIKKSLVNYPNLIAGEMEIKGFLRECLSYFHIDQPNNQVIIVKGISDYGKDDKCDDVYRIVSAKGSAQFIYELIKTGYFESKRKSKKQVKIHIQS